MNITGKGMKFRWLEQCRLEMDVIQRKTSFSRSMVRRGTGLSYRIMRLNGRIMFFPPYT